MKFTNTYRYVVLKQVMFLILFLIILVCMIKIDLEYLKQEVCIFREICASVPEERSAIPLETEQRSVG